MSVRSPVEVAFSPRAKNGLIMNINTWYVMVYTTGRKTSSPINSNAFNLRKLHYSGIRVITSNPRTRAGFLQGGTSIITQTRLQKKQYVRVRNTCRKLTLKKYKTWGDITSRDVNADINIGSHQIHHMYRSSNWYYIVPYSWYHTVAYDDILTLPGIKQPIAYHTVQ